MVSVCSQRDLAYVIGGTVNFMNPELKGQGIKTPVEPYISVLEPLHLFVVFQSALVVCLVPLNCHHSNKHFLKKKQKKRPNNSILLLKETDPQLLHQENLPSHMQMFHKKQVPPPTSSSAPPRTIIIGSKQHNKPKCFFRPP